MIAKIFLGNTFPNTAKNSPPPNIYRANCESSWSKKSSTSFRTKSPRNDSKVIFERTSFNSNL